MSYAVNMLGGSAPPGRYSTGQLNQNFRPLSKPERDRVRYKSKESHKKDCENIPRSPINVSISDLKTDFTSIFVKSPIGGRSPIGGGSGNNSSSNSNTTKNTNNRFYTKSPKNVENKTYEKNQIQNHHGKVHKKCNNAVNTPNEKGKSCNTQNNRSYNFFKRRKSEMPGLISHTENKTGSKNVYERTVSQPCVLGKNGRKRELRSESDNITSENQHSNFHQEYQEYQNQNQNNLTPPFFPSAQLTKNNSVLSNIVDHQANFQAQNSENSLNSNNKRSSGPPIMHNNYNYSNQKGSSQNQKLNFVRNESTINYRPNEEFHLQNQFLPRNNSSVYSISEREASTPLKVQSNNNNTCITNNRVPTGATLQNLDDNNEKNNSNANLAYLNVQKTSDYDQNQGDQNSSSSTGYRLEAWNRGSSLCFLFFAKMLNATRKLLIFLSIS